MDRERYIPRAWTCAPNRCRAAGLAEDTAFATKPELAARMIGRFSDAGHRVSWVAGDEVYGGNPKLRATPMAWGSIRLDSSPVTDTCTTPAGLPAPRTARSICDRWLTVRPTVLAAS